MNAPETPGQPVGPHTERHDDPRLPARHWLMYAHGLDLWSVWTDPEQPGQSATMLHGTAGPRRDEAIETARALHGLTHDHRWRPTGDQDERQRCACGAYRPTDGGNQTS